MSSSTVQSSFFAHLFFPLRVICLILRCANDPAIPESTRKHDDSVEGEYRRPNKDFTVEVLLSRTNKRPL